MSLRDDRALRCRRVDELLREIDAQRRQQLLLEAAGAYAPGLEQEARQTRERLEELVGEALGAQLVEGLLRLPELEAHTGEDAIRLRELDLVVLHDLNSVPARIANVEEASRKHLHARFREPATRRLLVVDDEPEVRFLGARAALEQGEELVTQLEEGSTGDGAVHGRRLEEIGVERHSLIDVVHLQRDVIDADEPWSHRRAVPTIIGRPTFGAFGTSPCLTDSTVREDDSIPASVSRFGLQPTRL